MSSNDDLFESLAGNVPSSSEPFTCPITGRVVDLDDVDSLAECWTDIKTEIAVLQAKKAMIRDRIVAKSKGDELTRRVRGEKFRVKITEPSERWDSDQLAKALNRWPQFAQAGKNPVIQAEGYKLMKREWLKMQKEDGPPEFEEFKAAIDAAYEGRVGNTSIDIEEI